MDNNDYLTQMKNHLEMYTALGWSVIPIALRDKQPDKRILPIIANSEGKKIASWEPFKKRTPIEWELKKWFGHARNIGIVTGVLSKIVVVDCDNEAARDWLFERGIIPENTPTVKTSKGWHFYFAYPDDAQHIGNRKAMHGVAGLDLRGEGGQVVAPPSIHSEGHQYHWLTLPHGNLPTFPASVFAPEKKAAAESGEPLSYASGSHIASQRVTYAERVLADRLALLRSQTSGSENRNTELNRTGYILGQLVGLGELTRARVEGELWSAARAIGLEEKEIGKTINSGVGDGIRDCKKLAEFREARRAQWREKQGRG